jgi:hypothetical protein
MITKELLLHRLSQCLHLGSSTPIHLRHQGEALKLCGYPSERRAQISRLLEALIQESGQHADSLLDLREFVLKRGCDVY